MYRRSRICLILCYLYKRRYNFQAIYVSSVSWRRLQGQTLSICWVTPKSHSQYLQIVILTNYQFMTEGIFHEMHRRRNI